MDIRFIGTADDFTAVLSGNSSGTTVRYTFFCRYGNTSGIIVIFNASASVISDNAASADGVYCCRVVRIGYCAAVFIYKSAYYVEIDFADTALVVTMFYNAVRCIASGYIPLPCTISECTLFVDGYKPSISSARVEIRSFYDINSIHNTDCNGLHIVEQHISKKLCLQLPLTIPPLGYAEGFIVFPFCPEYKEDSLDIEFVAKSARKDFLVYDKLNRY